MAMELKTTNDKPELTTEQLFKLEIATAEFFKDLLTDPSHSALQESTTILSTSVTARLQDVQTHSDILLESIFQVVHTGEQGLADLAGLLMFVSSRNTTFSELDEVIPSEVTVGMISFANEEDSVLLSTAVDKSDSFSRTDSEKTLITASAILSFTLLAMSIILIWVAGGWLALRKQVKILIHREEELTRMTKQQENALKQVATASQEYDEESLDRQSPTNDEATRFTSASGILGVNPYYGDDARGGGALDGLGIKMTPGRRSPDSELGSELATPMSEFSDASRMPLGITSMRKLLPSGDDGENDSLNNFRVERLAY